MDERTFIAKAMILIPSLTVLDCKMLYGGLICDIKMDCDREGYKRGFNEGVDWKTNPNTPAKNELLI